MRVRLLATLPALAVVACLSLQGCGKQAAPAPAPGAAASAPLPAASEVVGELKEVLAAHRQIIVLFADEKRQTEAQRAAADEVGQAIFHDNRAHVDRIESQFDAMTAGREDPTATLAPVLDYIESDTSLFDADRLAFRDLLASLQADVARNQTLGAIRLHKRIGDDMDALDEIQKNYDEEIRAIFSRFEQRAIVQKREKWDDYVAHLGTFYTRDAILKAHGYAAPAVAAASAAASAETVAAASASKPLKPGKPETGPEIFGTGLPPKVVALTFDDGPHPIYTAEITAILKQYGAPGTFFEVGNNLGKVDADGKTHLGKNAEISRELLAEGYIVGNHSMTHAQLSKVTGDALKTEILDNDKLLKAIDPDRPPLFRFPYGARNAEGKQILASEHLTSVMWNVDSMDWADPIPNSIADRVMREIDKNGRGIVLFHDIHERTVKALPLVMSRLVAEGYQFAGWDGKSFTVQKPGDKRGFVDVAADAAAPASAAASMAAVSDTTTEGDSWAVVIGIDDYAHWPKLSHAARDAESVKGLLVSRLGFKPAHVISLQNTSATRSNILAAFNEQLPKSGLKKTDNLFVFFAGHGATQHLTSGRDLGYIIPAEAATDHVADDAIPMTELQNISEALVARHVIFVMDACYSGLGLVRGGGSIGAGNFLRDNAHRVGRQMLTAGGADQMVADGGPGGHSIFTWTLLQGLSGKADMNGDNIITGTELAAYIAPAVASVSAQTPAFGSLPGSEGGEFVFTLAANEESLSDATPQLAADAIALNTKLEKTTAVVAASAATDGVVVKDLQGKDQKIAAAPAAPVSDRQQAHQLNDRGMQFFKEKNYAAARDLFAQSLKLQPDFALAANNLGFVYWKMNDDANAVKFFEAALKIDPSRPVAYVNLGDALLREGKADDAKKAFETYLQLAPAGGLAQHAKDAIAAH
ncbi:polysaccharide deacetylase family protein [Scleromatobacter humisilvae]|uniref:Polysaccharide deacetylase family protein n=1 Tax=Scleromatobacter humisilvae TaxID=2897159 RepID=A0A9X1YIY2_9BURK|nr:polysaccharide deacetylase family protein [Scleromatobacter humisilvae]MCK9686771.1 polysaccharide deacetylase family protein [Scleromatobacter humisilvae]